MREVRLECLRLAIEHCKDKPGVDVSQHTRFGADVRTEEDRKLAYWTARLQVMVERRCYGRPASRQLLDELRSLIDDFRIRLRLNAGLMYPELAVVLLREAAGPGRDAVEIIRADIDQKNLERWVVNLTVKYPAVTARSIAQSLVEFLPGYKPGSIEFSRRVVGAAGGIGRVEHTGLPV